MLTKFFKYGKGQVSAAINYLLNIGDIKNKKVVRGDNTLTESITNSIPFSRKYKSGVLSFEESDIDKSAKEDIMDLFEKTIFAGINTNDRNILWVQHKDKDRLELHFIIPHIHLGTQKAFNPYYYKVDLKRVDTFKNYVNLKYNLTDPNDPQKSRTHSYSTNPKLNLPEKIDKDNLISELYQAISDGVINNREELLTSLKTAGYIIKRVGKDYISVKTDDMRKAMRFKGGIFNVSFTSVRELEKTYKTEVTRHKQRGSENISDRANKLKEQLDRLNQAKSLYNQERYKLNNIKNSSTLNNIKLFHGSGSNIPNLSKRTTSVQNLANSKRSTDENGKSILSDSTGIYKDNKDRRQTHISIPTRGTINECKTDNDYNTLERIRRGTTERKSAYKATKKTRRSLFESNRAKRDSSYTEFKKSRGAVHAKITRDIKQQQLLYAEHTAEFITKTDAKLREFIEKVSLKVEKLQTNIISKQHSYSRGGR